MPEDWSEIKLGSIASGAAAEQFDAELQAVVSNILDPNTDEGKIRELHLVLKLKPDKEDRARVLYSVEVYSKLSRAKAIGSVMYVGKEKGRMVAYEQNIQQPPLFDEESGEVLDLALRRERS